jgi:hypothetical protein
VEEEVNASGGAEEGSKAPLGLPLGPPDATRHQGALDAERRLLGSERVNQTILAKQATTAPALVLSGFELMPAARRHGMFFGTNRVATFARTEK